MEQEINKNTEITHEQADEAIMTLRAYFRQEQKKETENGGEDLSAMMLVMVAGQQRALALEGKQSNIAATLSFATQADTGADLGKIFKTAGQFAEDERPEVMMLKEQARKLWRGEE